ncbi:MAG: hypothetical protein PHQ61_08610 [Candidatus Omnitrophica bacterium]|nr:hypothetical protein [Candidatus Omnitrophota bacterium]
MSEESTTHESRVLFEDKKKHNLDVYALLDHLQESCRLEQEMDVGQRWAKVQVTLPRPDLPLFLWHLCDPHLGSKKTDYQLFKRDYEIVKNTPNFTVVTNGDEVDNFLVGMGRMSSGVYENPISPEQQAKLLRGLFKTLDQDGKLLVFTFGNHNQLSKRAGLKFENTWLADFACPVLNCGGLLTIGYGKQTYRVALSHLYWGNSKLNITNAPKRFMEFEYPEADIALLGHTHNKAVEVFTRAGRVRVAGVGGTYKLFDEHSPQSGLGFRNIGAGGLCLALYPDRKQIVPFYTVEEAYQFYQSISRGKGAISK